MRDCTASLTGQKKTLNPPISANRPIVRLLCQAVAETCPVRWFRIKNRDHGFYDRQSNQNITKNRRNSFREMKNYLLKFI